MSVFFCRLYINHGSQLLEKLKNKANVVLIKMFVVGDARRWIFQAPAEEWYQHFSVDVFCFTDQQCKGESTSGDIKEMSVTLGSSAACEAGGEGLHFILASSKVRF